MTVSNQTARTSAVGSGAGGQTVTISFPYAATTDLNVYSRVTATGVETLLAETTNYTLTAASESGGTLTTVTAVAATAEIHIIRNTPMTQTLDLEAGGSFNVENIEDALDKATKLVVDNADTMSRCLQLPPTDPVSLNAQIPDVTDRASKYLYFGTDGAVTVANAVTPDDVTVSAFGETLVDDASAGAARNTLGLYYDVVGYGADPTGVADSLAAIQAANDAAEAVGGTVFFLPGTYKITGGLTIDAGVRWLGANRDACIIKKYGDITALTVNAAATVALENFSVDTDDDVTDTSNGITITKFSRSLVANVRVSDNGGHGIEFIEGNLSTFRDIISINNDGDGFKVNGASPPNANACSFDNLDLRGNAGWGFNVESGRSNYGNVTTYDNTTGGVRLNDRGNFFIIYKNFYICRKVRSSVAAISRNNRVVY